MEPPSEITLPPGASTLGAASVVRASDADVAWQRQEEIRSLIDRGLAATDPAEAHECFERAHLLDLNSPTAMSLHGMTLATVLHRYQQGIVFCEEAVRRQGPSPTLLVNLAKAYIAARNKREAVRCLRRALARSDGEDERARVEMAALGLRRRPVLPFLPRWFILNKVLGRLRHALLEKRSTVDDGQRPIPAELGQLSGSLEQAQAELHRK